MRIRFLSVLFTLFILSVLGCRKDDMQRTNCNKLQQAIIAGNPDEVETEINRICNSLPAGTDSQQSLNEISRAISDQCKLSSAIICYNCIETLPAQSEIKISINASGIRKDKIIDITRSGDKYIFAGMHD